GCDASILLSSKERNTAKKDAPPNGSMHKFYVIDGTKRAVEAIYPGVVSCADILAFVARDGCHDPNVDTDHNTGQGTPRGLKSTH
ncbi:Peroxidase 64, partial [Datura stramonium]|nr:Peroxidase 64 [Datura stramonium]